jgi:hypothetical protein
MTDLDREADQKFFEEKRKLSPKFPSIEFALDQRDENRKRFFETVVARTFLYLSAAAFVIAPFSKDWKWYLGDAAGLFVMFIVVCFIAGNRQFRRNGGDGHGGFPG